MPNLIRRVDKYFYKRYLDYLIRNTLKFHLDRVKKPFKKQFMIHFSPDIHIANVSAFVLLDEKPKRMVFQIRQLKKLVHNYLLNFINDNAIDAIKHEFAHLKYRKEGKQHLAWMNKQKLFKK